jgi:hypothetical protein
MSFLLRVAKLFACGQRIEIRCRPRYEKRKDRIRVDTGVKSVSPHAAADLLSHALLLAELLPTLRAPSDLRPFLPNRFQGRLSS